MEKRDIHVTCGMECMMFHCFLLLALLFLLSHSCQPSSHDEEEEVVEGEAVECKSDYRRLHYMRGVCVCGSMYGE